MQSVTMSRLKRAIVKEEFFAITGDLIEAIILNQMIYWSERVTDFDDFVKEERSRQELYGSKFSDFPLQYGWIHKSSAELKSEIMCNDSPKTIMRRLDNLVSKGYLERRNNPEHPYDRVYQYRVDFLAVLAALKHEGYNLEGYKINLDSEVSASSGAEQNVDDLIDSESVQDNSAFPRDRCALTEGQNDALKAQAVPDMGQIVPAIPETTEITSETTSSSSNPHMQKTRDGWTEDETKSELVPFFEAMGIDRLKRQELIAPMKAVITDLWRTRRVGKTIISRETVKKAFSCLSPEIIEGIFDKFDRQEKKGQIIAPAEYIKTLILNVAQDVDLLRAARMQSDTGSQKDGASFDIDEFVRLSMEQVHGK